MNALVEEIKKLTSKPSTSQLRAKMAILETEKAAAEDKTETLSMALRMAARELHQKLSTPTLQAKDKELTESKAAVKELQKKMENKKRKYELESANLEKELDDTQEENGELHSEIERLRQVSMDTSKLNKELKKAYRDIRKLQSQYETERQTRITAQDDLDETKRTIYSLEHKCEELMRV